MDLKTLQRVLERMFNSLGNQYLTDNFETEPFKFEVKVRKGERDDLHDIMVEIISTPKMPKDLKYKKGKSNADGADKSVIRHKFKEMANLVDPTFGSFRKTIGVYFI